jgi:hypothetical protein
VLWLDETYDEVNYRADTARNTAANASALIVAGSAGVSRLGREVFERAAQRRVPIIVITPEPNELSEFASAQPHGIHLRGFAAELLPPMMDELATAAGVSYCEREADRHPIGHICAPETILTIGAEGVCMTLQGWHGDDGRWQFRIEVDASTFVHLAPGEFAADELRRKGKWVDDVERALRELDEVASWPCLLPLQVHPDFSERILDAVQTRLSASGELRSRRSNLERWRRACARGWLP